MALGYCNHDSKLYITLSPWGITQEFRCVKCGAKKHTIFPILPEAYTGHGANSDFKPYKPPEPPEDASIKKKKLIRVAGFIGSLVGFAVIAYLAFRVMFSL